MYNHWCCLRYCCRCWGAAECLFLRTCSIIVRFCRSVDTSHKPIFSPKRHIPFPSLPFPFLSFPCLSFPSLPSCFFLFSCVCFNLVPTTKPKNKEEEVSLLSLFVCALVCWSELHQHNLFVYYTLFFIPTTRSSSSHIMSEQQLKKLLKEKEKVSSELKRSEEIVSVGAACDVYVLPYIYTVVVVCLLFVRLVVCSFCCVAWLLLLGYSSVSHTNINNKHKQQHNNHAHIDSQSTTPNTSLWLSLSLSSTAFWSTHQTLRNH